MGCNYFLPVHFSNSSAPIIGNVRVVQLPCCFRNLQWHHGIVHFCDSTIVKCTIQFFPLTIMFQNYVSFTRFATLSDNMTPHPDPGSWAKIIGNIIFYGLSGYANFIRITSSQFGVFCKISFEDP